LWIQNYSHDWLALQGLAGRYGNIGQFERKLDYMEKSIQADPQHMYSWANVIGAYTALGRFDEARDTGRRAIALGFDVQQIHSDLLALAVARNDFAAYDRESEWLARNSGQTLGVEELFIQRAAALGQLVRS